MLEKVNEFGCNCMFRPNATYLMLEYTNEGYCTNARTHKMLTRLYKLLINDFQLKNKTTENNKKFKKTSSVTNHCVWCSIYYSCPCVLLVW